MPFTALKKTRKGILYFLYLLVICIGVPEILYRSGAIDFYAKELKNYNPDAVFTASGPFLSVFGDSFTAYEQSYVNLLRDSIQDYTVVNHSVSGSGIFETLTLAPGRLKRFPSPVVVYQVYVGNDLANIHKKVNWQKHVVLKNIYYSLSNYLRILELMNYKAGQWKAFKNLKAKTGVQLMGDKDVFKEPFSPLKYSPYEKQSLIADSLLVIESVKGEGERAKDLEKLIREIGTLSEITRKNNATLYILVFPHCTQINRYYREKYKAMNLAVSEDSVFLSENYPFIQKLSAAFEPQSNIKIVNPLSALRSQDTDSLRTYGENDFHASPFGQKIAGALLLKEIRKSSKK
ncbi:MAG: hypothetical protein K1X92_15065 [Bacteroidia bacterium]|nr:hypothetical protein [Bacteroidia bacterium]